VALGSVGSVCCGSSPGARFAWNGKIEKYLYRQGSQRYAGIDSARHKNAKVASTCSAAMRFKSGFPQIGQCACSASVSVMARA
jgi:hypothetical protein